MALDERGQAMPAAVNRRIEVVLCTYNGERFVAAQIESILGQTRPVDLLSIYDDGSTDGTLSVIGGVAETHRLTGRLPAIRLHVRERNLGYGRNFWNAIGASEGDLLFLCDQDDVWHPDKVARLDAVFDELGVGLAFSDGDLTGPDGERLGRDSVLSTYGLDRRSIERFARDPLRHLLKRNCINGAAAAVRGALARSAPPLPDGMPHDQWLAMWLCASEQGVVCLPDRLYGYRQHGANVIGIGHRKRRWWLAGLWRSAWTSRKRDRWMYERFAQWTATTAPPMPALRHIAAKRAWLAAMVDPRQSAAVLAWRIAGSALAGRYRRFGIADTLLRDLFRLVRTK